MAVEDPIERLEQRLTDGYELIEKRRAAGLDVSKLEAFWVHLLHEYEIQLKDADRPTHGLREIAGKYTAKRCTGCQKPILWRITPADQSMPLDLETTEETGQGVYILQGEKHCKPYDPLFDGASIPRHMNHWTTCPAAETFKKRKPRPQS